MLIEYFYADNISNVLNTVTYNSVFSVTCYFLYIVGFRRGARPRTVFIVYRVFLLQYRIRIFYAASHLSDTCDFIFLCSQIHISILCSTYTTQIKLFLPISIVLQIIVPLYYRAFRIFLNFVK